ncbi:uncharacterized protein N7529_010138 [Penicillium soppii]|uniref:uncharacterized protein n=1 Tax=Penicillium soppii TaxID=69789 RepID=UPI0025472DA0|nr:uncharacterized protein N7529_010138 [Penicillium soppii]KAJ5856194.1 hypothetical protein N7529_010138 [Penicillium soppii]
MAVTLGGSIRCCGQLVTSNPKRSLESTSRAPLPFCLSLHLTTHFPSISFSVNGGSRSVHTPAFSLRQMINGHLTFGVEKPKCHRLKAPSRHGDWPGHRLILSCSPAKRPIVIIGRDASHMQLAITIPHPSCITETCASPQHSR